MKIIGTIFAALALPILILVAVLLNMENENLGIIGLFLVLGSCMFILARAHKRLMFLPNSISYVPITKKNLKQKGSFNARQKDDLLFFRKRK